MKVTASLKEVETLEGLSPGEDKTYGKPNLPRYVEASMFELLAWPESEATTDFKKPTKLLRDRLNKSSKGIG